LGNKCIVIRMDRYITYLRQFKVGPFAIFDIVASYLGIYLLAPLLSRLLLLIGLKADRSTWMWLTLPLAILFHLIFKQNTPLSKMVLDPTGNWLVKIVILFMLVMGISKIH